MQFVYPTLTVGFALALVPVLIHLINMMRHQRVEWAAMDFLLASFKKYRKWILLKQLILLAMRVLAVILLVAMLAQWVTRQQWLDLFGGQSTHHYVLVDDSYSMSDRVGATSSFDLARQVVARIAARAAEADTPQKLTLLRFSQATAAAGATGAEAQAQAAVLADFNSVIVDSGFEVQFEEKRGSFDVTQLSSSPRDALSLTRQLVEAGTKDTPVIYVVSDFRAGQWENPTESRDVLVDLQKKGASVQLIDCARVTQPNLAIVEVKPADDTRAAGVPLFVDVAVKNFGAAPVKRVLVKVRSLYFAPELAEDGPSPRGEGDSEELPTIVLDELKPGETAVRRVQVYFAKPGQHVVEATLPDDPVVADNRRWCVIDFPEGDNVLVIDGSPATKPGQNLKPPSYFLEAAFQPSQRVRTGILPTIQPPAFLRDIAPTELAKYQTVYLLDVDRLDDQAVTKLEAFVRAGGGLAVFVGDQSNLTFMNTKLYREGGGLSPVELDRIDLLPPPLNEDAADIEVDDHPIFAMFQGERNPFIRMVTIEKYLKAKDSFAPPPGSTVRVAARLRNRQPLAVEHKFGEGHVVVFLTAIDKNWNNWAQGPSFIGVLLKLQSFLTASRREIDPRVVGTPLEVDFDKDRFRSTVQFLAPAAKQGSRTLVEDQAQPVPNASGKLRAKIGVGVGGVAASATQRAGIYEAWQQKATEGYEVSRFALNVDPTEGDLAHMESATLTAKLAPVRVKYSPAEQFELDAGDQSGMNRSLFVMALLILLLLIEQFVAYQFSYHPAKVAAGVPVASRGLAGRAMARVAAGGEPVATSRGGN